MQQKQGFVVETYYIAQQIINNQNFDHMSGQSKTCISLCLFIFISFLSFQTTHSQDLYWVNGSGNWHDASHWSETSGGPGGAGVPTRYDDVVIDHNSFSSHGQYIKIKGEAECNNLIWENALQRPVFRSWHFIFKQWTNAELKVYSSIQMPERLKNRYYGDLIMKSGQQNNTIDISTPMHSDVIFDGPGGGWALQNDLNTSGDIRLQRGAFYTNDYDVTGNEFVGSGATTRKVNFGSSEVTVDKWDFSNATNLDIQSDNLNLSLKGGFDKDNFSSANDIQYNKIGGPGSNYSLTTSTDSATCWDSGDGKFHVTVSGTPDMPLDYELYEDASMNNLVGEAQDEDDMNYTFSGLSSGNYYIKVSDSDGDDSDTQITTDFIGPAELSIEEINCIKALSCYNSSDAALEVVVSGGTEPYDYTWVRNSSDTLGSDSSVVTGIARGDQIEIFVTDANGCGPKESQTLFSELLFPDDSIPSEINISIENVVRGCAITNNGEVELDRKSVV